MNDFILKRIISNLFYIKPEKLSIKTAVCLATSGEAAAQIGSMLGKVIEGQTGALSRYGYKFDEAQEKILKYGTEAEKVAVLVKVYGSGT
ncbi:MAG: hypothetical protein K2J78_07625 [Muribaculaceae bacterium]|nr:hypothetical protein [Muribaculaceae bacterium]